MLNEIHKDYNCIDMVVEKNGKKGLMVKLKTKEVGEVNSRVITDNTTNYAEKCAIWDMLADEAINEYEDRLKVLRAKK